MNCTSSHSRCTVLRYMICYVKIICIRHAEGLFYITYHISPPSMRWKNVSSSQVRSTLTAWSRKRRFLQVGIAIANWRKRHEDIWQKKFICLWIKTKTQDQGQDHISTPKLRPHEKAWYILWFCRTSGTVSPSLFEPYNLNHVSVFPVTLRLSCLPLACITLTYPSRQPIAARVLAYLQPDGLKFLSFLVIKYDLHYQYVTIVDNKVYIYCI